MVLSMSSCFISALAIKNAVLARGEDGNIETTRKKTIQVEQNAAAAAGGRVMPTSERLAMSSSSEWEYHEPPSWYHLDSELTGTLQLWSQLDDWIDQCIDPFADRDLENPLDRVSNYDLFQQPSGLCMVHGFCYYEECVSPQGIPPFPPVTNFNSSIITDDFWKSDTETLNLPEATVHPVHVGDVSTALKFAAAHKKGVSVKTSGHSYTGASTKKNTLLLNLSRLQKYSPDGSIVECDSMDASTSSDAYQAACKLATARNKDAVIRVGGGEIWDEVIRAVYKTWNVENTNKYRHLSGSAGTVSAAGGWLASGGLGGANGNMRMYGLGVDQVLHVEMVLPSGLHVHFGPTEWDGSDESMIYPRTTLVTGYCNHGDLSAEERWKWEDCTDDEIGDVDFHDLWYAVRGGGGGAYGVITSIYYQLHEYSPYQRVTVGEAFYLFSIGDVAGAVEFVLQFSKFLHAFFFDPESIAVSKFHSNSCSSDTAGGLFGGDFSCYNGAGTVMKTAWEAQSGSNSSENFIVQNFESFADFAINIDENAPYPVGRVRDEAPLPMLTNTFYGEGSNFIMVPEEIIVKKRDELLALISKHLPTEIGGTGAIPAGNMYIMGGNIPFADDGLNSLPHHRRHGGYLMSVIGKDARDEFNRLFYGVSEGQAKTGDNFPGALCHNHASLDFPTPLKENWAEACNVSWSKEEKEEKCMSYQEAAWGTTILKKLETIHKTVDPNHLFDCQDCVGYAQGGGDSGDGGDGDVGDDSDGRDDETSSATVSSSNLASGILMCIVTFIAAFV